ncbi:hypothetical protein IAR50_000877 [Cryptococcus sp. DSM 104548]
MSLFPPTPAPDFLRPSLFDLLAQDQLTDLFHPVLRYVLSYLAQQYPRYFLHLLNHHEETYGFLLLLIQRHHLKKHNASISEHFYGLRLASQPQRLPRLSAMQSNRPQALNRRQRWIMLLFLVGLPYVRARAQDYYERLAGGGEGAEDNEGRVEDWPHVLTKKQLAFKRIYPYANVALDASFLFHDIFYLFEKTYYYRPWHRWLNLRILRATPDDQSSDTSISSYFPPLLPPLLLLLKLSQWWYSPSSPRASSVLGTERGSTAETHAAILPPRPLPILPDSPLSTNQSPHTHDLDSLAKDEVYADGTEHTIHKGEYGKCPLCRKKWQNPAVLPSGWVVCWRCGWEAIEGEEDEKEEEDVEEDEMEEDCVQSLGEKENKSRKGRCPLTGVAVGPGQLRRVLV